MWTTILYFTLVGLATAEHGWKNGNLYRYELRGRTVVGLHQVADQFAGVLVKGKLTVQPKTDDTLNLQVHNFEQAEVHANLSSGWSTFIEDHDLNYKKLPVSDTPFELKLKNGVVDKMYVDKNLPTWEVNVLKAIASQLQVDTQAENLKKSRVNQVPVEGQTIGVYKTVEDTVTGECETIYDISPLPQYVLQSRPELVPLPNLLANGQVIDIVKTKNYSNCEQRMAYHFGLTGLTDWEPASNQMGSFLSRSSVSRIVVTGTLKSYTIQSSVTTNKIVLAPHLYNNQKGIVASRMNLTLEAVTSSSGSPQPVPNPRTVKNLVYEYNAATKEENAQNHLMARYSQGDEPAKDHKHSSSSESSSQSSSSSSEESLHKLMIRSRRSIGTGRIENNSGSSSSESNSSDDSDSSSTGSTEDFWQPKPTLNEAPNSPFMPYFIGYLGNSIQASSKVNGVSAVYKLAKELGEEVLNGNAITGAHTLSKFTVLVGVVHTMNTTQLLEATEKLYYPYTKVAQRTEGDDPLYQAWVVFRDAVAEVGTGPALVTIKQWILSHKVSGAEAAHLVGVLPDSARYPTTEYMNTFFELVKNEEVQKQRFLNTSVVTAFTDLVRKAQVNRETAHNRYPVHSFGDLTPKNDRVVSEQYVTYLESQLKKAVEQGDSPNIQLYIRALGNTAHPKILGVFEPYLEGHEQVSDFQRLTIVASLDKLTTVYPRFARSVLFKIYQNSGETSEVRVAAVMQLMKTNPPAQTLQRMAQHTNYDHSRQVSAAVKSAIEDAARLQGPTNYQLAQNAKSAVHLLTTEELGLQQSHNFLRDYIVKEEELMYKTHFAYIQGEDSLVPSSAFYTLWRNLGGYKHQSFQVSWMTSNFGSLVDLLFDQFAEVDHSGNPKKHGHYEQGEGDWTLEKIGKFLNFETDYVDQVEGNFLVNAFGFKNFFTFDNHTIEQLPQYVKYLAQRLRNGWHFNYNKVYNKHTLQLGFPTATGLPFFYIFATPTRAHFAGKFKFGSHPDLAGEQGGDEIPFPKTADVTGEFKFMYTTNMEAVLGFTTPYNHKTFVADYVKNFHVGFPVQATVQVDFEHNKFQAKFQPWGENRNEKFVEYSTVAYTSVHDLLELEPIAEGDNTEEVHVRPVQRFETTVGEADTGFAFDVKVESEQKFVDWATLYNAADKHDFASALFFPLHEGTVNNNNFTVTYNTHKTTGKYVKLFFTYDDLDVTTGGTGPHSHNKHRSGSGTGDESQGNDAVPSSTTPASEQRQKEFLQRAVAGIKDSYAQVFDLGVQFEGQTTAEYVATGAYAKSHVHPKRTFLFYFGRQPAKVTGHTKPYQVALQVNTELPFVPFTDFEKALHADPTSHTTAKLYFGENVNSGGKVYVQGTLKQSEGRREYVEHHPTSALCRRQMEEGNYFLPACRNATASANYLDYYKFTVTYEGVPEFVKFYVYKAYTVARYFGNHYVSENFVTLSGKEGQVDFGVKFTNDLTAVNVSFETPLFTSEFNNLYVAEWVRPVVVVHPEYEFYDRLGQHLFRAQHFPTCVVDKHQATTFDNRTYPVHVGKCWHALVHSVPHTEFGYTGQTTHYDYDDFSVLVREGTANQKELLILVGRDVVQVLPTGGSETVGKVVVNGQNADFTKESVAQFKYKDGYVQVQVYALPTGEVRLLFPGAGLEVTYDGTRVKLQASNTYRGRVRGLCGTFDGEYVTDFTTPRNCIVKDPSEFAASYAVVDGTCQGPAKELHQRALNVPCYKQTVLLGDVVSEGEAGRYKPRMRTSQSNLLRGIGGQQSEERCSKLRSKVIEQSGKTCFSLHPQMTCSSKCKATSKTEKQVEFHCVPNSAATKHWVGMIKKGANPDFSQKPANEWFKINVPERCVPN